MRLRLWGTRGSIPSPTTSAAIEGKVRAALSLAAEEGIDLKNPYALDAFVASLPFAVRGTAGGDTACLEVRSAENLLIFDCGSGLRRLGVDLMKQEFGRGEGIAHIFMSHTHWDHIMGWPFFIPSFVPGNKIFIYGVPSDLEQRFRVQQTAPILFPIPLDYHGADITFVQLKQDGTIEIGDSRISNMGFNHPGGAFGYRVEDADGTLVYATDSEYKSLDIADTAHVVDFFRDADALVFDAMFSLRESYQKEDWGHSSALAGADLASRAGVHRLLLFHHDPYATDEQIWDLRDVAEGYLQQHPERAACQVIVAYDGYELELWRDAELTTRVENRPEGIVVHLGGRLVAETASSGLDAVGGRLKGVQGRPLVFDLAGIDHIDDVGLAALFAARRRWCPAVFCGLSTKLQRTLELAGALDYVVHLDTAEEALTALKDVLGPHTGRQLGGRYTVHERIKNEHLGSVYRATDRSGQRQVNLLILCPSFGQLTKTQLLNATRSAARLRHPQIADVYELGQDGAIMFVTAEYTAGQTIKEALRSIALASPAADSGKGVPCPAASKAVQIGQQVAKALEYAHSQNVVHGGLNLDNIVIAADGGVKLVYFGLGGFEYGRPLMDLPAYVGSPEYLAPEQLQGRGKSRSTDLYALGVCLYEMLTGMPPFASGASDTEWNDVVGLQLHQRPVPPRRRNIRVSGSLEYLVLKLIERSPADRPASALEVQRILASLAPEVRETPLLGRETDLQKLRRHIARVAQGESAFLVLNGQEGAGKTRLMQSAVDSAKELGMAVLRGEAHAFEDNRPYRVFAGVLQQTSDQFPAHRFTYMMRELGDLSRVLTALAPDMMPSLAAYAHSEVDCSRLEEAICEALRFFADDSAILLIIDGAEWVDGDSLRLLTLVVQQKIPGVLTVALCGSDDPGATGYPLAPLESLAPYIDDEMTVENLGPLEVHQMASTADAQLPSDFGLWLFTTTDGNPLFIEQLLTALVLRRPGPGIPMDRLTGISLQETILLNLEILDSRALDPLRQAAVLGHRFTLRRLCTALDQPEAQVLESINLALRAGLVYGDPCEDRYSFSHPMVRRVMYSEMLENVRRRYHLRAAQALDQDGVAGVLDDRADQLAHHYLRAGDHAQAINYLARSIRRARKLHAWEAATNYTDRALDAVEHLIQEARNDQDRDQRRKQKQDLLAVRSSLTGPSTGAVNP